jgi:hypothetical protein
MTEFYPLLFGCVAIVVLLLPVVEPSWPATPNAGHAKKFPKFTD